MGVNLKNNHIFFYSSDKDKYYLINLHTKNIKRISKSVSDLLELCNGKLEKEQIISAYDDNIKDQVKEIINTLFVEGVIEDVNLKQLMHDSCYIENSIPKFETIYLNITSKCNLRCSFCSSGKIVEKEYMNIDDYVKIAEQLNMIYIKKPVICITGGEPLVYSSFFEIANIFIEYGFKVCLLTNGTLINQNNYRCFQKFSDIGISLDSLDEKDHEIRRGNIAGCYKKAIKAIKLLNSLAGPKVWIQTTIDNKNLNKIDDIVKFADVNKIYGVRFGVMHSLGKGKNDTSNYLIPEEFALYYKKLLDLKNEFPNLKINESFSANTFNENIIENSKCRIQNSCLINHDGSMSVCPGFLKERDFTDIKLSDHDFLTVVNNSKLIKYFKNHTLEDIDECAKCGIRYYCYGGCRGEEAICTNEKKERMILCLEKTLI